MSAALAPHIAHVVDTMQEPVARAKDVVRNFLQVAAPLALSAFTEAMIRRGGWISDTDPTAC